MTALVLVIFSTFLALLASGIWVAMAGTLVGLGIMFLETGWENMILSSSWIVWNSVNSFTFTSLPLFLLMGFIILESGVGERIYSATAPLLEHFPGGLLYVNIGAGALFAAMSGSSIAAGAAIGSVSLPEMEKRGYPFPLSAGSVGAGSVLAPLIPPSLIMIFYCGITEQSIGKQFMAGIIPGLILTLMYMLYIWIHSLFSGAWKETRGPVLPWRASLARTKDVWLIFSLIAFVLGSIFTGVATASEAAALGAFGSALLAVYNRRFNWPMLQKATRNTVRITSQLMFTFIGFKLMAAALARAGLINYTTKTLLSLPVPPLVILGMVALIFLILGFFIEGIPMMLMVLPVVFPTIIGLGYDPIWFGIIVVILCNIGNFTPPVGVTLFVLQSLCPDRPLTDIYRGVMPFALVTAFLLVLLVIFPEMALYLPRLMLGG